MSTLRVVPMSLCAFSLIGVFALSACTSDASRGPLDPSTRNLSASKTTKTAELPFRGSVESVEKNPFSDPGTIISTDIGAGIATHLGAFKWYSEFIIDGDVGTGSATLTAANGDQLFTTLAGIGAVAQGGFHVVETHTITGGTGRFSGASGTFMVERSVSSATNHSTGSFVGTIVLAE